ncbi:MAG: phenylalanine--tRNA ligase subunit alpha [Candidatus Nomurabacteria bacterium]|jgi:phenylalanyl-tRNA synthetase alpha chain|nr:phenylalanine--tRNA ligase subunit alpha [Candidatus Nomurabacteria bacterium]
MDIEKIGKELLARARKLDAPRDIMKAPELKELYKVLPTLPGAERPEFGRKINALRGELEKLYKVLEAATEEAAVEAIDVTAPMGVNQPRPSLMTCDNGSRHPLMTELERVIYIYNLMGFRAVESRQLDDDYHMFSSLNFPVGHPARDGYDTFYTEEGFIPPAHTSTMQNRILRDGKKELEAGGQIAAVSYGRVFRNEDQDATHEHTLYQCEGVFVSRDANLGQMIAVLREFFENYYGQKLEIRTQPAYFPFTEPSMEFLIKKPASLGGKGDGWLEMLGCGMIHPNVLREAGIDPAKYRGFAWGGGIDRLVMLKYGIDDIRHFESGKLRFLKEF